MPHRNFSAVNTLRGLAALAVVLYHANGMFWRSPVHFWDGHLRHALDHSSWAYLASQLTLGCGFLGVNLFFVLSGFCIHLPAAQKCEPLNLLVFAVRRFFRIYPTYLVTLLGCFLMLGLSTGFGLSPVTWRNFLGHLVFWHYADGSGAGMGISPVLWTVALEVQFYLLYAVSLPMLRRLGLGRCAALGLGIELIYQCLWATGTLDSVALPNFLSPDRFCLARFGEWLLGAWVAEAWMGRSVPQGQPGGQRCGLSPYLGPGLLILSLAVAVASGLSRTWLNLPVAGGFALMLLAAVRKEAAREPDSIARHPLHHVGRWLGERSYSLYLVHFSVLGAVTALVSRVPFLHRSISAQSPALLVVLAGGVALSALVTELVYRCFEAPSHQLARSLARRLASRHKSFRKAFAGSEPMEPVWKL